ncbi:hypothetical protein KIW84_071684 [Lathyrus oleraceus]|uniref:DUF7745 domain-containing protein n=1 Tax=Pisum sativum TaxID=3888 RepID=A0A9D4VIX8_PEA|nr:hypothetical protein KIW84_071684 [Pisum sativum]
MEKTDRRNTYQYKLRYSKTDELRKLREFMVEDFRVAFKKAYGNMLDFLLAPALEEFAHLLQLSIKNQAPYMIEENFQDSAEIAQALCMKKDLIESTLRVKGNTQGLPSKFLFESHCVCQ